MPAPSPPPPPRSGRPSRPQPPSGRRKGAGATKAASGAGGHNASVMTRTGGLLSGGPGALSSTAAPTAAGGPNAGSDPQSQPQPQQQQQQAGLPAALAQGTSLPSSSGEAADAGGAPAAAGLETAGPTKRQQRVGLVLQLSEGELKAEVPKMLTASDPYTGNGNSGGRGSRVRFSHRERAFKQEPPGTADMLAVHFALEGALLPKESAEAQLQATYEERRADEAAVARRAALEEAVQAGEEAFFVDPQQQGASPNSSSSRGGGGKEKGGFTYWERAAQTFDLPRKEKGVGTEPTPVLSFGATCTQWEIHDAYLEQFNWSKIQAAAPGGAASSTAAASSSSSTVLFASGAMDPVVNGNNGVGGGSEKRAVGAGRSGNGDVVHSERMARALLVLERLVGQNAEDEVFHDCKYWDDPSDAVKAQGSLLPLWQFGTERTRRHQVTTLGWNPRYPDLFAVGYGSYAFENQGGGGMLCCYSLKNTGTPQYTFATESGVMALDFHPQLPHLLAVGCHDGRVLVYDLRSPQGRGPNGASNKPLYASSVRTGRHTEPVWAVRWQPLDGSGSLVGSGAGGAGGGGPGRELAFHSVSSDGQVACWLLARNELRMEGVMQLKLVAGGVAGELGGLLGQDESAALSALHDDERHRSAPSLSSSSSSSLASGTCLDFCSLPGCDHLFLVGTEEGRVHKCSKAYSGQYLETYGLPGGGANHGSSSSSAPSGFEGGGNSGSGGVGGEWGGHHMAVYAVRWNPFHPRLFLSCSADWTVKLWDHARPHAPLLSFDLGNSVGDVQWSPHASSTFAAVTGDGRVHVFDLASNKHEPLCVQKVVRRAKLTHVAFSPAKDPPLVLVGDDRGEVHALKLSPNLRDAHEPRDEGGNVLPHDVARLQFNTAERLLQALLTVVD